MDKTWPLKYTSGASTVRRYLEEPPIVVTLEQFRRQSTAAARWLYDLHWKCCQFDDPCDDWPTEKFGLTFTWET
jgi:hypothetical protein